MIWVILFALFVYFSYRHLYARPIPQTILRARRAEMSKIPRVQVPATDTFSPRDKIAGVVESLDWCNEITRICWPQIGKIVEDHLDWAIQPLINHHIPPPFSKFKFISADLGKDPLRVDRVIVHKRYNDSIALDLDVQFQGSPNIKMKCAPLTAPFGIKELRWSGRLSVVLRPLIKSIPLVGAVHVAMIDHPTIDMDFTGIANLSEFGPLEKVVRLVLRNVTASMVVLPNRFMHKLSHAVDFFRTYFPPFGVMVVTIQQGRGFTKLKRIGKIKSIPDLYCRATFGLEEMKTDVVWDKLEPVWGTTKAFLVSAMEQPFRLKCLDKDRLSKDDLVGSMTFTARELLAKEVRWERFHERVREKVAKNGELLLISKFYTLQEPTESLTGRCVVSVLIDRAKNLPPNSKSVACRIEVGDEQKETPPIREAKSPIPGMDPVNPVWNFSCDTLCDDISHANVKLTVLDSGKELGTVTVFASELMQSTTKSKEGYFPVGLSGIVRAKVILRGLVLARVPDRVNEEKSN